MRLVAKIMPNKATMEEMEQKFPDFRPYYFEAIQALFSLSNELEKLMDQYFGGRCEKFSRARFLIMIVLLHSDDQRAPPNEIAKKLSVTRGNMTGLVDSLEADGYVKKYQDKDDRRQVWIEITSAGRKLLDRVLPDYFKCIGKFMSPLKRDEILQLSKSLEKLETGAAEAFNTADCKK
jgi:DNA-binding MarR family transcriptional regulator